MATLMFFTPMSSLQVLASGLNARTVATEGKDSRLTALLTKLQISQAGIRAD